MVPPFCRHCTALHISAGSLVWHLYGLDKQIVYTTHPNGYLRKRNDERWKKFFLMKCFKIPILNIKDIEQRTKPATWLTYYLEQRRCSLATESQQSPKHTLCPAS